ncbi:unnamed protein product [Meganyctiphanes norvegica]|uniref:Proton-coupled folate transporter n=1 Tax=Meganyctiphanes norvegica TaxID=48144 RepID=A0AAV2RT52_MEGNR
MEDQATSDSNKSKYKVFSKKIKDFIKATQIEPVLFLFGFTSGLESVFITNLIIDKVCEVQCEYEKVICENLDSGQYEEEQNKVQRLTAIYGMERHFTEYLPAVVTVFLLAALGTSRGLKFPLFVTVFGDLLKVVVIIFNVLYWSLAPVFILTSFLPYAVCGGYSGFMMSCYAYLGLTTDKKSRTTRLAMVSVFESVGTSLGTIAGPAVYDQFGYLGVFISDALVFSLILVYILFGLKNCKPDPEEKSPDEIESTTTMNRLKTTLTTAFKKRENRGRAQVIGHISGIALLVFIFGVTNFYFLYTRKKFSWDYESYSVWSAVSHPATLIGTLLILPSLSYMWNVGDSIICLIGYISRMWQYMLFATAPYGWVMYVASLSSVCGGMIFTSSRSELTKIVPPSEVTSIFAVISALENIIPVLDNPMYTYIYNSTLEIFPGTVFAMASVFSAIGCFLYTWLATRFPKPKELKIQKQAADDDVLQKMEENNVN